MATPNHSAVDHSTVDKPKSTSSFFSTRSFSFNSTKNPDLYRFGSIKKPIHFETTNFVEGKVKKLCISFEAALLKKLANKPPSFKQVKKAIILPNSEDRIVVYFTSLRGIRRTYEDCYTVLMIFRGFRVCVDERDISMDSDYRKELQSVLGGGEKSAVSLPQVFIRGKYVGGAEEVKQLHEVGELVKLLKGFPLRDIRVVCESCGDARFVPCLNCSGSRKVYVEEEDLMRRCGDCNENGLMRCLNCCY